MDTKINRFKEAFRENFNLGGLAVAAAVSLATLNPIPLLVGVVAEAAYLLFVPDSKWYENRLQAKFDAEVQQRRERLKAQVYPTISRRMQERFERLETIRAQITAQPGMESAEWFRQVLRKLDYLLEKFLLFSSKETQFRTYLHSVHEEVVGTPGGGSGGGGSRKRERDQRGVSVDLAGNTVHIRVTPDPFRPGAGRRGEKGGGGRGREEADAEARALPAGVPDGPGRLTERWTQETVLAIQERYDDEINSIREAREREEDFNTQAVLDKRVEVLEQRKENVGKIGRILTNLGHQMELLEDSFGLINDQLRARSPEQVLADIEGVVYQTDSMTKLLEELAPYEEASQRLAA